MVGELCPLVEWECNDGVIDMESERLTFLIICSLRSANSFLNASIAALHGESRYMMPSALESTNRIIKCIAQKPMCALVTIIIMTK